MKLKESIFNRYPVIKFEYVNFASTLRVGQCKKKIDMMNDALKYAMKMNDLGFIHHVENEILFYEILNGE